MTRWLKLTLLTIAGIFTSLVILAAIYLASYDEEDYRELIIASVKNLTGDELTINGAVEVKLFTTPSIIVTDIELDSTAGIYTLHANKFEMQLAVTPLLRGILQISKLRIADAEVSIYTDQDIPEEYISALIDEEEIPSSSSYFLTPDLGALHLENIAVNFNIKDKKPAQIHLDDIRLYKKKAEKLLLVEGAVGIEDKRYQLEGQIDRIIHLFEPSRPYAVDLLLKTKTTSLSVEGVINTHEQNIPVNLLVEAKALDMNQVLQKLGVTAEKLGGITGHVQLQGDLKAPRLTELQLTLARDKLLELKASGSMDNLVTQEGTDIRISGFISDRKILAWALPEGLPPFKHLQLQGAVRKKDDIFNVEEFVAHGIDTQGLTVDLKGTTSINDITSEQPFKNMDMTIEYSSPTTEAAKAFLFDAMPEVGPVKGKVRLTSPGPDLAIEDLDITAGRPDQVLVRAQGNIGKMPLDPDIPNSKIDIGIVIKATSSKRVTDIFNTSLPELGPLNTSFQIKGVSTSLAVRNGRLTIGQSSGLQISANGSIDRISSTPDFSLHGTDISLSATAPSTESLSPFTDWSIPKLGQLQASARLTHKKGKLGLDNIKINIGPETESGLRITANGSIQHISATPEFSIQGTEVGIHASSPSTESLTSLIESKIPELGQLQASAKLTDKDGLLGLENINVVVGPKTAPVLHAEGLISNLPERKEIDLKTQFDIATATLATALLKRPMPELGRTQGNIHLSDADGSLGIEELNITATYAENLRYELQGTIDDLKERDKYAAKAELSVKDPTIIGTLFDQELPSLPPLNATGRLSGDHGSVNYHGDLILGDTETVVDLTGSLTGERPQLVGTVTTPVLFLKDFGIKPDDSKEDEATSKPKPKGKKALFSREPLSFEMLDDINLSLQLNIDEIRGIESAIGNVNAMLSLQDGQLLIDPAQLIFEGGAMVLDFKVDTNEPPQLALKVTADDVVLSQILAQVSENLPIEGLLNIHIDVNSTGHSPHEIASNMNGQFGLVMENGKISRKNLDLLASDVLGWAISSAAARKRHAALDCGIIRTTITKGVMTSETIYVDGPLMTIGGTGTLDLSAETIELVLMPKQKKEFWATITPVKILGPITDPKVNAIPPASVAAKKYGGLVLVPQIFIPVKALGYLYRLVDDGDGSGKGCRQQIILEHESSKPAVETQQK